MMRQYCPRVFLFFFNDTATTEIYTLSLHDALPICVLVARPCAAAGGGHKLGTFRRGSLELRHLLAPGRRGAGGKTVKVEVAEHLDRVQRVGQCAEEEAEQMKKSAKVVGVMALVAGVVGIGAYAA